MRRRPEEGIDGGCTGKGGLGTGFPEVVTLAAGVHVVGQGVWCGGRVLGGGRCVTAVRCALEIEEDNRKRLVSKFIIQFRYCAMCSLFGCGLWDLVRAIC